MRLLRAVGIAFYTYSSIPMPKMSWGEQDMGLALACLPLVGIVVGGASYGWYALSMALGLNGVLVAAVFTAIPLLLTGGIHMDGFMDTVDALASHQEKERKLEIMKDPHTGAFAVLYCGIYLLLYFALSYSLYGTGACAAVCVSPVLSRALAVFSASSLPSARQGGMLHAFTGPAKRVPMKATSCLVTLFAAGSMLALHPAAGLGGILASLLALLWYWRISSKQFGGATGDTTGFFLQLCELGILVGALIGCYVGGA